MSKPQKHPPGVFYPPKVNVWPHEKKTAETLADNGFYIEFRPESAHQGERSADRYLNGTLWELKAPNGKKLAIVSKNLQRAKKQSSRVVFDSLRIKELPDSAVERELRTKLNYIQGITQIKFINKRRKIIDIKRVV